MTSSVLTHGSTASPPGTLDDQAVDHESARTAPRTRKHALTVLAVGLLWCTLAMYVAHAMIPGPVVTLPGPDQRTVRTLFPEGWAFFTRDAREDRTALMREEEGRWTEVEIGPNGEPEYAFGLRRLPRVQLGELNEISRLVPDDAWEECAGGWATCSAADVDAVAVANPTVRPQLCGGLAVISYEPVPWAWAPDVDREEMPARVARVEVTC